MFLLHRRSSRAVPAVRFAGLVTVAALLTACTQGLAGSAVLPASTLSTPAVATTPGGQITEQSVGSSGGTTPPGPTTTSSTAVSSPAVSAGRVPAGLARFYGQ